MCNNFSLLGARRNKAFQAHSFRCLAIITARNSPSPTPNFWSARCRSYLSQYVTHLAHGSGNNCFTSFLSSPSNRFLSHSNLDERSWDFLSISSPLTVSQHPALLVQALATAISCTELHAWAFITREHMKTLAFASYLLLPLPLWQAEQGDAH